MKAQLRIAFRAEGDWWVAYLAQPDTMDGAEDLGRMRMNLARIPACKQLFMETMQAAVAQFASDALNAAVTNWNVQPGPEHERSGNA